MKTDDVVKFFGTQVKAAIALGIRQSAIANWVMRGFIPPLRQLHIEKVTRGKLKADPIGSKNEA
jgi:DNA-binding transcriptional regulator YdaS (Cro superfamily)